MSNTSGVACGEQTQLTEYNYICFGVVLFVLLIYINIGFTLL